MLIAGDAPRLVHREHMHRVGFESCGGPKVNHKVGYARVDDELWITIRFLGTQLGLRKT
jgi:hypothetical protein